MAATMGPFCPLTVVGVAILCSSATYGVFVVLELALMVRSLLEWRRRAKQQFQNLVTY